MSKASANRTIKFITKAGTYTAMIMSPKGDLYQEYESQTANTSVKPSFEDTTGPYYQPKLYFILTNSRVMGEVIPDDVEFYIGNGQIVFDTSGLSTGLLVGSTLNSDYAGAFRKLVPGTNGETSYGLQILKNLPAIVGWSSITIKMVGIVTPANSTVADRIGVTYPISISQKTGDSAQVTITSPDNFTIKEKGGTCELIAKVIKGGDLDSGWTFEFFQMADNGNTVGWTSVANGDSYTVSETDVQTSAMFRVVATKNGETISDMATVMDVSDPYDIEPMPTPEDETIEEGSGGSVEYKPRLIKRESRSVIPGAQFKFILTDYAGNILNTATKNTPDTQFIVTEAHCVQGSSADLSLTIIAV